MKGIKLEVPAWRAAAELVDLPTELVALFDRDARIRGEREADINPQKALDASNLVLNGATLADAVDQAIAYEQTVRRHAMMSETAARALKPSQDSIRAWFNDNRDTLIVEVLRPAVADILHQAAPLVDKLAAFAPAYDEATILGQASRPEVEAWRKHVKLDSRFQLLLNAWGASWKSATQINATPAYLRPDAPGGVHVWRNPEQVDDPDVRDGRNHRLLAIARNTNAGYLLRSPSEIVALTDRTETENPHLPGEPRPRRVLLLKAAA